MDKIRIIVYRNRIPMGYVKSVSYKNGTFKVTQNKMEAKRYSSQARAQSDIDSIAVNGLNQGCIFSIDF